MGEVMCFQKLKISPQLIYISKIKCSFMRIALYARVSKALDQKPENQLIELRKWAKNANHEVIGEFIDECSSKDTRPQKELLLKKLRLSEIDGVAFWSLDRWGRNMSELVLELEEFSKAGKSFISMKEGLDLSTSAGRLMANVLASMANFERDRIQERTFLGLARAKAWGKIGGRHPNSCGCGTKDKKGKLHDGYMKPIRDAASNTVIGWQDTRNQTPSEKDSQISGQNATP